MLGEQIELRMTERFALRLAGGEVSIEVGHEHLGGMILKFPESRQNAIRARLDEGVFDVRHASFPNRTDSRVASRERDKRRVQVKTPDLTDV
jgi:hypothetical protein